MNPRDALVIGFLLSLSCVVSVIYFFVIPFYSNQNRLDRVEENMVKECIKDDGFGVKINERTRYVICFEKSVRWMKDVK